MCFGEGRSDTLGLGERAYLQEAARRRFPAYGCHVLINEDDLTWVVLEPRGRSAQTPRFTICRIHPSILVMVEDQTSARRFCSAATVEDAMAFVAETTQRGLLARSNVHAQPEMAQ